MVLTKTDYMDPDVAYLYGLIIARGSFQEFGGNRALTIDLEFTNLQAQGRDRIINVKDAITLGVNAIRNRIGEVLGEEVTIDDAPHSVIIKVLFQKRSMAWRELRELTANADTYRNFSISDLFYDFEPVIHQEFMRGVADGCGFIRPSNQSQNGRHRVYLQISNDNWIIPIQICRMLQVELEVPVQVIQWGHPNTREPNKIDVPPTHTTWAREHQIKIFAEHFLNVGFCFSYKQEILEELAQVNEEAGFRAQRPCNPLIKKIRKRKPDHPCESSDSIPNELRGSHFDSYFEICRQLGCEQGTPAPQRRLEFVEDEE